MVHHREFVHIVAQVKADIQWEVGKQLELGPHNLLKEDRLLFDMQLLDMNKLEGEDHQYWLLAMKAAQKSPLITSANDYLESGVQKHVSCSRTY